MNMTTLLDKIAGRQQERLQAREDDFSQLVVQITDGQEPDADHIEYVLDDNQKTIDDLRKSVEILQRRRNLKSKADQAPDFFMERKRIESEIAEADRIFKEADAKHNSTVNPLHFRLRQLKMLTSEAEQARRELWDTCGDDDLVEQLDKVSRSLDEASRRLATMETEARNHCHAAKFEREQAKYAEKKPDADMHSKEAVRHDNQARPLEVQLPALRQQVADLERQDRNIREKMLVP